ncbi:autotransporter assembly complex protein TamA [Rappaport israeli]|uniref:autotransporter assembly complex protein TamA n=1 Tax=Rappaport israeli TaxID=1839807 RepID=UPI000B0C7069|nr:autotransporter assembly complex family protein [Rappaport israeli]
MDMKQMLLIVGLVPCAYAQAQGLFQFVGESRELKPEVENQQALVSEDEVVAIDGKLLQEVVIEGIDEGEQLDNALVFLTLNNVVGAVIEQPDYIRYLIGKGEEEIAKSQQPFGYYNVQVGHRLEWVEEDEGSAALVVRYTVALNELTRLSEVDVRLTGQAQQDEEYNALLNAVPMQVGQALNHQSYEQYKREFIALGTKRGYFSGQFTQNVVYVDPSRHEAEVKLHYDSGNRFKFRAVNFDDVPLNESLLQRFIPFEQGDYYHAAQVSKLQQDLQGSGYFKQTFVGNEIDKSAEAVDIQAQLTMNKPRRYAFGVGYSTDIGVRGKVDFDYRYINRRGHSFSSRLYGSQKEGNWDNVYRIPAQNPTTDYYYFRFGGAFNYDKFDQKKAYMEGGYNFRLGNLEHRYGLNALYENFRIGVDGDEVVLLYPQAAWVYTSTDNRLNPQSGYQMRAQVLGGSRAVLSDVSFAQTNMDARFIQSFADKHRVSLRAGLGATWTTDFHRLPASLRYFAGGDRSIRGYAYNVIGSRDENGANLGGRFLATAGAQYEYYFKPDWAGTVFIDAGDAFVDKFKPVYGAGVGVHWRSPVGPIKANLAHGFNKPYGDNYRVHINIGAELDL